MSLSHSHQLLFQATFLTGEAAILAWQEWRTMTDFENLDSDSYALLPYLSHNLTQQAIQDALVPRLRGIQRLYWCKNQISLSAIETVLQQLQDLDIDVVFQSSPACMNPTGLLDRINLQIQPETCLSIVNILKSLGWHNSTPNPVVQLNRSGHLDFYHDKYLPIILSNVLSHWCYCPDLLQKFWHRAIPIQIGQLQSRVLGLQQIEFYTRQQMPL